MYKLKIRSCVQLDRVLFVQVPVQVCLNALTSAVLSINEVLNLSAKKDWIHGIIIDNTKFIFE